MCPPPARLEYPIPMIDTDCTTLAVPLQRYFLAPVDPAGVQRRKAPVTCSPTKGFTMTRDYIADWRRLTIWNLPEGCRCMCSDVCLLRERQQWRTLDYALASLEVSEFPDAFLVGLLTVTASMALWLNEREGFYRRVAEKIGLQRAEEVLLGLACEEGWQSPMRQT
jgi:hypothetical protein